MTTEEAINKQIQETGVNTNLISDGYHTFGELYDHRIQLFISLLKHICDENETIRGLSGSAAEPKDLPWRSIAHSDGSEWPGWFILGIGMEPGHQITYHLPITRWSDCDFAQILPCAPKWDGHTSADVLERLKNL